MSLAAALATGQATAAQAVVPKVKLELPLSDSRTANVVFAEFRGDVLHLCIDVDEPAQPAAQQPGAFCWATELATTREPITLSVKEAREISAELRRMREAQPAAQQGVAYAALPDVDVLAQEIRRIDGAHNLGAGALAEALMPFLRASHGQAPDPGPPALWVSPEQLAGFVHRDLEPFGTYIPARKTCAGKFTLPLFATPTVQADSVQEDAARWEMAVLLGNEMMLHPDKRTHSAAVNAYMDAGQKGLDLTGAVDAARAAQKEGL